MKLDDLRSQNNYLLDLDVRVCFDNSSTCDVIVSVLKNTKLPQRSCDWSAGLQGNGYHKTSIFFQYSNAFAWISLYDILDLCNDGSWIPLGMSVAKWLTNLNVDNATNPLPDHLQSLLLEDHGISNMMKETHCSRTTDPKYTTTNTTVNGWNIGTLLLWCNVISRTPLIKCKN